MKNSKLGIILIAAAAVIIGIVFIFTVNKKPNSQTPVAVDSTQTPTAGLSQTPTAVPTKASVTSAGYSPELKAEIRNDFINNCNKQGNYGIPVCSCAADYLSEKYSETELAKMYIQYHTSSQVPSAVRTAIDSCKSKK